MNKLLVICGTTGTGKTDIALTLAKKFKGEIVSADSRQVYLGMDIGTGKELESKRLKIQRGKQYWLVNEIPIYLYDLIKPDQSFSLANYQQQALTKIKEIQTQGKLPILVGGTGLYIQAVTEGLKIPKAPPDQKLREKLEQREISNLLEELKKVDPESYEKIDKNNKRRIVRALEVYIQTGETFSSLRQKYKVDLDVLKIGLTSDRETLYQTNDERVEKWFNSGFVSEVEKLMKAYSLKLPAMSGIGYQQVASYIKGKTTMGEAKQKIKFALHGYIRRQLTWFKRDRSIYWYDINEEQKLSEITSLVKSWLNN